MADRKVVKFPSSVEPIAAKPYQGDLFGDVEAGSNFFSFLFLDDFDQDELIEIITRNAVQAIVDLRPQPVFQAPDYDHSFLTSYFYSRGIDYFEYAFVRLEPEAFSPWRVARNVNRGRPRGLTLWLYDDASKRCGWFDLAKGQLNKSRLFRAEIHSRFLKS